MRRNCEKCGKPATKTLVDKIEINGGHLAGQEHLPPMIHHQHVLVGVCDEHTREAKIVANDDLRKVRDGWQGKYPVEAS